jgi:hypothetical protein
MAAKCGKSDCDLPLSDLSRTIKCAGFCGRLFHTSCSNISRNLETLLATSKNILWFCDPCLHLYNNGFEKISSLYNEILKSREQNIKLVNGLYEKINNSLLNQAKCLETAKTEILSKNEEIKSSYADTVKNNEKVINPNQVVIIKPKDKNQSVNKTKADIKSNINPNEILINGVIQAKNGGLIIKCKKQEDTDKIKNIVENKFVQKYDVKVPEIKNPRIKIIGIDDKPENNEEIINILRNQNVEFFGDDTDIKVVTVLEVRKNNKTAYFNLIVEINPKIFKRIMEIENVRINFNWNRCKVFDAIHIKRCFKCCSYDGHNAKDCTRNMVCFNCAGNHKSDDCDQNIPKCINCENQNIKLNLQLNTEHSAMSQSCSVYKKILEKRKRTVNYIE